ncbi:polysaccharide pyruvyl transferase family protein [Sphingomonas sp. 1P06PA]|uniref:polysaccharide pyruvyl transferase family protein n=1 Tax=Sphingomonas sp. 1P06PA TaxID=554121 RepID=UPI0039A486D4
MALNNDPYRTPNGTGRRTGIVLVTRIRTNNQGNQALSIAWRDAITSALPNAPLFLIERSPPYLRDRRATDFAADPIPMFEALARKLARIPSVPTSPPAVRDVTLDLQITPRLPFGWLRRMVRARRLTTWLGIGRSAFRERLSHFRKAHLVVMNPAGEFYPGASGIALTYLLDLRVAQLVGCKTAVVNLSLETSDPVINAIAAHVFDRCDLIEFREERSRDVYRQIGGRAEPLILPDLAVMSGTADPAPSDAGDGLAVALNGLQVERMGIEDKWAALIAGWQADGLAVTLMTNEAPTDMPLFERLAARTGAAIDPPGLDQNAFRRRLGDFRVIVSSRLHSAILGMAASRPVVAIEPGLFKMAACLNEIGGDEPLRYDDAGWTDRLRARVANLLVEAPDTVAIIHRARQRIADTLPSALVEVYDGPLLTRD